MLPASNIPGAFPKDEPSGDSTQAASVATAGAAGLTSTHHADTAAPSTLLSTASPAARYATYSQAENTKVPEADVIQSSTAASAGPAAASQQSGTLGKILGTVGIGAAAGGAGVAASKLGQRDTQHAVADTPEQPTTTTGIDSYSAPTRSGPAPSHHRKESIPTTAYPAGVDSPAPINAPVGGTSSAADETERKDHSGRNAGLAAAGIGAGAGTAAYGAHQYNKSKSPSDDVVGTSGGPTAARATSSSAFPSDTTQKTTDPRQDLGSGSTMASTGRAQAEPEKGSRGYGTAAAAAGIGAGAGAAAYGAHEYNKGKTPREDLVGKSSESTAIQPTSASAVPSSTPQTTTGRKEEMRQDPLTASASQNKDDPQGDSRGYGTAAAAAGIGAGAGAAAYGAHEYNKGKTPREDLAGKPSESTTAQPTSASAVPSNTAQPTTGPMEETRQDPFKAGADRTQDEPERDSRSYGKAATAAGVGAGAGAAGAHAMRDRNTQAGDQIGDKPYSSTQTAATSEPGKPEIASREKAVAPAQQDSSKLSKDHTTPAAVAGEKTTKEDPKAEAEKDRDHTGRNAALAGAAGAGAGAYGAHEYNKHQAEDEAARAEAQRQKDLAEQEAARQKQFEKDQKVADKQAAKEEKKHQKELEKEEKAREKAVAKEEKAKEKAAAKDERQHQKVLEQEEKEREKAAAATEAERRRQLEKEEKDERDREAEEAERKRREKEMAAAAVGTGTAAAGTAAYARHDEKEAPSSTTEGSEDHEGRNRLHKDPPEEKKPNILKRIFKRRKNKETGQEEEYETDEEDEHQHDHDVAGAGAGAAAGTAAAAGGTAVAAHETQDPEHKESSYEAASGGLQKPSYNPFSQAGPSSTTDPTATGDAGVAGGQGATSTAATGTTMASSSPEDTRPHEVTTGLPYDPAKDPERAKRLTSTADAENMGGLAPHHHEGQEKPGLGERIIQALKPLPDREEIKEQGSHGQGHAGSAAKE